MRVRVLLVCSATVVLGAVLFAVLTRDEPLPDLPADTEFCVPVFTRYIEQVDSCNTWPDPIVVHGDECRAEMGRMGRTWRYRCPGTGLTVDQLDSASINYQADQKMRRDGSPVHRAELPDDLGDRVCWQEWAPYPPVHGWADVCEQGWRLRSVPWSTPTAPPGGNPPKPAEWAKLEDPPWDTWMVQTPWVLDSHLPECRPEPSDRLYAVNGCATPHGRYWDVTRKQWVGDWLGDVPVGHRPHLPNSQPTSEGT